MYWWPSSRVRRLLRKNGRESSCVIADQLSKFTVVVWNSTSGDTLTEDQKAAFRAWVENGGTFFGIHGAGEIPTRTAPPI